MKRLLAMLMAVAMMLALAACGNSSTSEGSGAAESSAPAAESSAAESTTPAEESAPAESAASDVDYTSAEPVEITWSSTFYETETGGELAKAFGDYLSEITGGNMEVQFYWGGTLYGDTDVLEGLSSGAVQMTNFGHMPHIGTLNYLAFPSFGPNDPDTALKMFNEVCFDNEETSKLIADELAENGIMFVDHGVLPGGANAFCATYEFSDLASLVSGSKSFGNMDAAIFETMGFQVSAIGPGDTYDALTRGLIDSTQMGLTPMVSMQWYDVAPYWALDGTYTAGNFISCNLDWWNSLSETQQAAIQAATDYVVEMSYDMFSQGTNEDVATVEAATGNKFVEFSQEDIDTIWAANFESKASSALSTAEANGKGEGMRKILEVCAEVTGYDWQG